MKKTKTAIIIPDCHIPYHDAKAYNLMIKVAKSLPSVDEIVILGDYADMYAISAHPKNLNVEASLIKEVASVNAKLDELDTLFPKANKVYLEGNHEYRLSRYFRDKAPELFGTVDCQTLFELKNRPNWKWVPYGPNQKHKVLGSKLYARHEPVGGGTNVAAQTVVKCGGSVIFGHVHRIQEFQTVMIDGKNHRGITCGWLGDGEHPVMDYVKNHNQWSQGFNITFVQPNGNFFAQTIHIVNYECAFGGRIYKV